MTALSGFDVEELRHVRLVLTESVVSFRRKVLGVGMVEIQVPRDFGILATELEDFQPDPTDRIIAGQ